jgi:capsule polysaccharide export protein KpsC/LpsZ
MADRSHVPWRRGDGGRAFVGGTYWWNYPIVRELFSVPAGQPVFFRTVGEAIDAARRNRGRVIAWATRLEPRHEAECADHNIDLVRIEDGFIRSIGLGAGFSSAASLAVDTRGIYYDPGRPSDLETLLETAVLSDEDRAAGARIKKRIIVLRLSKYNLHPGETVKIDARGRKVILVPGQVTDDASVLNSMSQAIDVRSAGNANLQLLRQARARNPDAYLIYKAHPDVRSGLRKGQIAPDEARAFADLVVDDVDIAEIIGLCDGLETISSLAGFEALLRGKAVTVHGLPFYAGWGLTNDLAHSPRRTARRTIEEICYVAFVQYTQHVHPVTRRVCTIDDLLNALDDLRSSPLHRLRGAALLQYARFCEFLSSRL